MSKKKLTEIERFSLNLHRLGVHHSSNLHSDILKLVMGMKTEYVIPLHSFRHLPHKITVGRRA
jgi:hypothetical protein